jgi:membrane protease YdiL (CAAX protease family)
MTAGVTLLPPAPSKGRVTAEILIVLGLSLGASAAYSVVSFANKVTRSTALSQQTTSINNSLSERPLFDLIYQLMAVFFDLVPVVLVVFLLWQGTRPRLGRLGIDFTRPGRDSLWGLALALVIGAGGIGVYLGSLALGVNTAVSANNLDAHVWTIPVLILRAFDAGITEEVIVIGYLFARLRDLGWRSWQIILGTALLRGTYHLYQGVGGFIGNLVMGLIFGWLYHRYGRLLPFVIAHILIDAAIFIGYPWAAATFPALLG